MDVVVVGSCMIDLISNTPRLPKGGETLHGTKFAVGFGGKGANQCVASSKLGCSCLLVARVGSDSFGRDYVQSLKDSGIDTEFVKITEGWSSGMASIVVADNGENQIVIVAGANNVLSLDDVNSAEKEIKSCHVLVTQMETPVETTVRALQIKKTNGFGISIFNGAPAQSSLPDELYTLPTIFCVNETEAELLTGEELKTSDDAAKAAAELRRRGCNHVIITLGGDGAVYLAPNSDPVHVPSVPANVVDTTGAGDSFIGTLAYYLSLKKELCYVEAIRRACAVAAISVERNGTQISFPNISDVPVELL